MIDLAILFLVRELFSTLGDRLATKGDRLATNRDSVMWPRSFAEQPVDSLKPDQRRKKLILCVDDDPNGLTLELLILDRAFGEQVLLTSAQDGSAGLALANLLLPDLVLTDVMMPAMDGFEMAARLKSNPLTQNVPFVFLSGRGDPETVRLGMELGAKGYWSLPILPRDLIARVEQVMGIEAQWPPSPPRT